MNETNKNKGNKMKNTTETTEFSKNTEYKITNVIVYDYVSCDDFKHYYEATLAINNEFVLQIESDRDEFTLKIPASDEAFLADKDKQDQASANIDVNELEKYLSENVCELNLYALEDFGIDINMCPENVKYRHN